CKPSAAVRRNAGADVPALALDEAAGDVEAEPGASFTGVGRAVESFEQTRQRRGRRAEPPIPDSQNDPAAALLGVDCHGRTSGAELDRVFNHVRQRLPYERGVGQDGYLGANAKLKLPVARLGVCEFLPQLTDQGRKQYLRSSHVERVGIELGRGDQVLHVAT